MGNFPLSHKLSISEVCFSPGDTLESILLLLNGTSRAARDNRKSFNIKVNLKLMMSRGYIGFLGEDSR